VTCRLLSHRSARFSSTIVAATLLVTLTPVAASAQPGDGQSPPGSPAWEVGPTELTSVLPPNEQETQELTIGNQGDATLEWSVRDDAGESLRLPIRPTTPVNADATDQPGGVGSLNPFIAHLGQRGEVVELEPENVSGQITLTQSERQAISAGESVTCQGLLGLWGYETSYLRHFTPADFGVTGDLDVSSIRFGVEAYLGQSITLTVNLYTVTDPSAAFRYDNFQPIGTAETQLEMESSRMRAIDVPVTGTVPAGETLVVEVKAPSGMLSSFFIGAHPAGQAADSYLRAPECGLPEPTPTQEIGFPQLQFLINVTGTATVAGCDVPGNTPWLSLDQTEGTVAPGEQQALGVNFDSEGLVDGDARTATLCLTSNDPQRPRLAVPVRLDVEGVPAIDLQPESLASQLEAGQTEQHTLTVTNTGSAPLTWQVSGVGCEQLVEAPWLAVSPDAGATAVGEASEVTVTIDPAGLTPGDHTAELCVESNDPDRGQITVPVSLFTCDRIIDGLYSEELTVTEGVTCLAPGAQVQGAVNVLDGAGLIAREATITGPLSTFGATVVELTGNQIVGPVSVRGTSESAIVVSNQIVGSMVVVNNLLPEAPVVVSDNEIIGSLFCTGNQPPPTGELPNTTIGGIKLDQCVGL
jgi:hypothetical protein